jgi:2-polyprenyl-3-methyl-5-hydroxy-6-metoxy-1,4-benzoquinol methylase
MQDRVRRFYEAHGGDASGAAAGWLRRLGLGGVFSREERLLLPLLDARPGHRVLDAGCGAGAHTLALAALGARVWALDLSPRLVDQVLQVWQVRQADLLVGGAVEGAVVADLAALDDRGGPEGLPGRFDRILCAGVLEFLPDPARCVAALGARLAPGGRLVVAVPRAGLPGAAYALWHLARNGIAVRLPRFGALDRGARAAGLRLRLRREDPLGHNLICAWDAPSSPPSRREASPSPSRPPP